ncbi:hypothetical protein [Streptomyces bohaiensis]|uniref:hypothetical protein n=1 Tax=Streptomyces bohaiensis TaxID=1431344 RepID=UPI003B7EE1BF
MNSTDAPTSVAVPAFPPVVVHGRFGRFRRPLHDGRRLLATALLAGGGVLLLLGLAAPGALSLDTTAEAAAGRPGPAPPGAAADGGQRDAGAEHPGRDDTAPDAGGAVAQDVPVSAPVTEDDEPVLAPVRLADPAVVALLSPGDIVDVLAAPAAVAEETAGTARRIAHRVRVADIPQPDDTGPADWMDGALIVVEVSPRTAVALAGSMNDSHLTVTRW